MNLPYPLERGDMSLERYLLNILVAIVKKSGGEVSLTSHDILKASSCSLTKTPSEKLDALILRTSPAGAELYFVPEAPSTTDSIPTPRTKTRPQPTSVSTQSETPDPEPVPHRQLSDLDLYLREQEMAQ